MIRLLANHPRAPVLHSECAVSHRPQPDDGAFWLAARHFLEADAVEHRLGAEPHAVVTGTAAPVDRICLEQFHLASLCERDRAIEQRARNSLPAEFAGD